MEINLFLCRLPYKQKNIQTNEHGWKHNLLGGGNKAADRERGTGREEKRGEERRLHHTDRSPGSPQSSAGDWLYRIAIPSSHSKTLHPCLILSILIFLHLLSAPPPCIIFSPLLSTLSALHLPLLFSPFFHLSLALSAILIFCETMNNVVKVKR